MRQMAVIVGSQDPLQNDGCTVPSNRQLVSSRRAVGQRASPQAEQAASYNRWATASASVPPKAKQLDIKKGTIEGSFTGLQLSSKGESRWNRH